MTVPSPFCTAHPFGAFAACGACGKARREHATWIATEGHERLHLAAMLKVVADERGVVTGSLTDLATRLYPAGDVTTTRLRDRLLALVCEGLLPVVLSDLVLRVGLKDVDERHVIGVRQMHDPSTAVHDGSNHHGSSMSRVCGRHLVLHSAHLADEFDPLSVSVARVKVEDGPEVVQLDGHGEAPSVGGRGRSIVRRIAVLAAAAIAVAGISRAVTR